MEKKHKLSFRIFRAIFVTLLLSFLGLYFSIEAGYYDYGKRKKVTFTQEQIAKFEEDVNQGKNVLIEDYLEDKTINYSNKASNLGYKVSEKIGEVTKTGINGFFKFVEKLVAE